MEEISISRHDQFTIKAFAVHVVYRSFPCESKKAHQEPDSRTIYGRPYLTVNIRKTNFT